MVHSACRRQAGSAFRQRRGRCPVYFGVAPVHQLADYAGTVKTPVVLRSASQARAAVGYAADWALFSLSEAVYLHFMSAEPVGPIVVVNLLDPDLHRATSETTKNVTFVSGRAEIETGNGDPQDGRGGWADRGDGRLFRRWEHADPDRSGRRPDGQPECQLL